MVEVFIVMLITFFVCGTAIAIMSRKLLRKGFEEFVIGGYRVGGLLSAMTYAATTYSAFMMVGLVGLTYALGVAALGFELVYLVATIGILTIIGPVIWRKSRERKWVSPSGMVGDLYGSRALASLISILYLVTLTPYLAAQLKGVGEIFSAIGLGYEAGVIFTSLAIFLWIATAGLWSVATTDAFQGLWMITSSAAVVIWATAFLLPSVGLDLQKALNILAEAQKGGLLGFMWSINMFVGLSIPWIFFALTNPQVVQRLYIPRHGDAYKKMVKYFAFYGFIYTLLCVFLGLLFRSYVAVAQPDMEMVLARARDSVTPTILLKGHALLASATFIGIIAAAISTSNSIVLTVASAITKDLYMAYVKNLREEKAIAVTYLSAAIMIFMAFMIALHKIAYVVELSVISSALLLPLAPITVVGVYLEPKRKGLIHALLSLVSGLLISITSILIYGPSRALTAPLFLGMPMPLWILVVASIPMILLVFRTEENIRGGKGIQ